MIIFAVLVSGVEGFVAPMIFWSNSHYISVVILQECTSIALKSGITSHA